MVNITLMDGYGLHVFFSGLPVLRQVEVRESWLSIQPTYFWANAGMTVTVQGYGFNSQRLYNCSLTYMAQGYWDTVYNPEKWSPGKSVLQEQIMTVPTFSIRGFGDSSRYPNGSNMEIYHANALRFGWSGPLQVHCSSGSQRHDE